MAEEKKDTEKKQSSTRRSTAKKSSGGSGGRKAAAKSGGSGTRSSTRKKETATRGKGAAEATSKTADSKASETATSKAPAKKAAGKKPAAKKADAKQEPAKKPAAKSEAKPKAETKRAAKKEAPERPVVSARARFVRVAPRKARLIADQVRGLPLDDALPLLRFSSRSAAQDIRKLLESAAANAENNHDLVADDLMIKDIHVDEGPTLRRYRPRALGRATRINKRTSHIAVALTPED